MAYFKLTGMHSHRHPFLGAWLDAARAGEAENAKHYAEPDAYDTDLERLDESGAVSRFDTRYRFYQGAGEYIEAGDTLATQPHDRWYKGYRGYGQTQVPLGPAPDAGVQAVNPPTGTSAGPAASTLLGQTGAKALVGPGLRGVLTGIFTWMTARTLGVDAKHCMKLGVVLGGMDFAASLAGDWLRGQMAKNTKPV